MVAKRNRRKLNRNPKHNLLDMDIVNKIRAFHQEFPLVKQIEISSKFGINAAQISRILNNKIWKGN